MNVLNKVVDIIVDTTQCRAEDVIAEAKLTDLGVDSLKAITVIFELEEAFNIEIPNEVITSIVTVNDLLNKLEELRQS